MRKTSSKRVRKCTRTIMVPFYCKMRIGAKKGSKMRENAKNVKILGQKKSHHNGFIFCKFFKGAKKGSKRQNLSKNFAPKFALAVMVRILCSHFCRTNKVICCIMVRNTQVDPLFSKLFSAFQKWTKILSNFQNQNTFGT